MTTYTRRTALTCLLLIYWISPGLGAQKFQLPTNSQLLLSTTQQNIADQCFSNNTYDCDASAVYRTFNGTCNNLQNPWRGSVGTPYVRLMEPLYKDNQNGYRVSKADGSDLPLARVLSTTFLKPVDLENDVRTRIFLLFSQIVSHDIVFNGIENAQCCSDSGDSVLSTTGVCQPIIIPSDDPFYSQFGRRCQEFRISNVLNCPAVTYPKQPSVDQTLYLDLSTLYGTSDSQAQSFRTLDSGKLIVQSTDGKDYLPLQDLSGCPYATKRCYSAPDPRVNQHIDYSLTLTLFLRFHNYVADQLLDVNPSWASDDELVYQTARKIVIGSYQHILYGQWLPMLIGHNMTSELDLFPKDSGYASGYNQNINPNTLADFAGAAYRTLHSLTPNTIRYEFENSSSPVNVNYSVSNARPGDFLQDVDASASLLRDLLRAQQLKLDRAHSLEITAKFLDFLVPTSANGQFGDDQTAKDIQRGRDYGLRTYNDYKELCGGNRATSFDDLSDRFDSETISTLQSVYKDVDDIDYYIGALLEISSMGTLATPSLQCVFGEAFYRYKFGDRFYYEFGDQPGSFTPDQLDAIRSVSLSTVVCAAGIQENIGSVQENAFLPPHSKFNPLRSCSNILNNFDLSSFADTSS